MAGKGGLPPAVRAALDAMWRSVAAQMTQIANAEIIAVVGQAFRGGKLDAAYIVPAFGASKVQAGRVAYSIPATTESTAIDITFPIPFADGAVVRCYAIEVNENVTAVCSIYDGSETTIGCRVLIQCGEGITSIFSGTAPTGDLAGFINWLAVAE